jgi:hypothetical protein
MTSAEVKTIIQQELPKIIAEDASIRDFILRTISEYYAPKQETESRFDRILAELQLDQEEQARKWEENNRKWVQVLNINDFDDEGEVFGRPDQVEIDVIIKNGMVILCEIKSSMSKAKMYVFQSKVEFYQKRHQRQVGRKLVVSPMMNKRALPVAENLGIEVYSYAEDVILE